MSMKIKYIALCLLLALVGCQRDEEMEVAKIDVSNEVIEPRYSSVYISSTITCNAPIEEVSVCLSTTHDFDFSKAKCHIMTLQNDGNYSVAIRGLSHSTTYYVCYVLRNMWSSIASTNITTFQTTDTTFTALITTSSPTSFSYNSAVIVGNVTDDGGSEVTERGIVYSTYRNPTTIDGKVINGSGLGEFNCVLSDLQATTIYYARAYAINEKGTAYGEEVSFTTPKYGEGIENGYKYVDLGLSVKWATMNVGASTPEGYGNHFAWGELEPKTIYDWSTYKHCKGNENTLTKYNTRSEYGTVVDYKTKLDAIDDVATVNWGGSWRIPTDEEWAELFEQCTQIRTTQNGVDGCVVTSNSNGNSIFLPAAGERREGSPGFAGSTCCYWSSSLYDSDFPSCAYGVSSALGPLMLFDVGREFGHTIRPVCP